MTDYCFDLSISARDEHLFCWALERAAGRLDPHHQSEPRTYQDCNDVDDSELF